ncbi:MAG: hypothetical protein KDC26_00015 [Armatimonadetes bacterium]|nr:hypothetical protein [Armatimonadota bacterium]
MPCHGAGGSGPFPLETYEQVRDRSELVRFQVLGKTMPPPAPFSDQGFFSHFTPLNDEQLVKYQLWIRQGKQKGDQYTWNPKPFGMPVEWETLKQIGQEHVKDDGPRYWKVIKYQLPNEPIRLSELRLTPSAKKAFRSATIAYFDKSDARVDQLPKEPASVLPIPGELILGSWAPGYKDIKFRNEATPVLSPGGTLVVLAQFQPSGKPESADLKVDYKNLFLAKGRYGLKNLTLSKDHFEIPAGEAPIFDLETIMPEDGTLVSLIPEARFYCAKITVSAITPDNKEILLFDTQRWDPYWIGNYQFGKEIKLPKGTRILAKFQYNNDDKCAMNEGRTPEPIFSGLGIEKEVCRLHIKYSADLK